MKKLSIICLSLSLCFICLLGLINARAAGNEGLPARRVATTLGETAPGISNNSAILPADKGLSSDSVMPTDSLPPGNSLTPEEIPEYLQPFVDITPEEEATKKLMALTFDDGPSTDYTPALLDGLRERGVHVTFFIVGARAEKAPELVRRIYDEGHAIGGHSYDHTKRLTKLNSAELDKQVNYTANIIAQITEEAPSLLLRPPYGAINEETALKTGKAIMMWNIDPRDWDVRNAEKIRLHIVEHAKEGGVVILHDIVATTAEGVLAAIDELQPQGWAFVTLPELFKAYNIPLEAGGIYRGPESYILPKK